MNKKELVQRMSGEGGPGIFPFKKSEKIVESILQVISDELVGGGSVTLVGFGTFKIVQRKARTGRNPKTGETIKIAAKKVVIFKAGKALKEKVQ